MIIDFRNGNGVNEYLGYPLGGALVTSATNFAKFLIGDPANPGSFRWGGTAALTPSGPHYSGKVVILVDELTQGIGEFTAMTLRAVPGAVVVGSTSAGAADFFNSTVPLPGGVTGTLSGTGLYQANGRPVQRTGLVPDVVVTPTVAGVAAARDEVLDEATRQATIVTAVDAPKITLVANAEGEAPTIAPNTWVMIKGTKLAPEGQEHTRIWKDSDFVNGVMPTHLDGVSVTINGKSAYLWYISPTQINVLAPVDAMDGDVKVVVTNNGVASDPFTAKAQSISPSFFYVGTGTYILAQRFRLLPDNSPEYTLVGPTSMSVPGYPFTPVAPGDSVVLWANGFGPTSDPVVNGSATQSGTLNPPPIVTIGGAAAPVTGAVLVAPGLYQINITVPAGLVAGDYPIVATYKGASTQTGLMITIKN